MIRNLLAILSLLALIIGSPAQAEEELSAKQREALAKTVNAYSKAFADEKFDAVIGYMPSEISDLLADQADITTKELRAFSIKRMRDSFKKVKLLSFRMNVEEANIFSEDKTPYAFIPTETVMRIPDGPKVTSRQQTLGLIEDGKWRLLPLDNDRLALVLRRVFPSFADAEIPDSTIVVEE